MEMIDQMNLQQVRVVLCSMKIYPEGDKPQHLNHHRLALQDNINQFDIRYTPSGSRTIADQPANVDVAEDKLPSSEDNTSSSEEDEPEGHDAGDDDDQGPPGGGQTDRATSTTATTGRTARGSIRYSNSRSKKRTGTTKK
jgi:hypothetical protein